MQQFYFSQLLRTVIDSIDNKGITTAILSIAGVILVASLLYSIYEAFSSGGDVRRLGVAGVTYLVVGLVFLNYPAVWRDVNAMFNSVAGSISGLNGFIDIFAQWRADAGAAFAKDGFKILWPIATNLGASLLNVLLVVAGFVIFPITYSIFTLMYAIYGAVLYVTGPFVIALLPSRAMGHLARTYVVNLMIFQSWGLIYAIIQLLMTAIDLGSVKQVLDNGFILNQFVGTNPMILLGIASLVFSIAIAVIPFIAKRIVEGDVGSTVMTMAAAIGTTVDMGAKSLMSARSGLGSSLAPPAAGPPPPPRGPDDGGGGGGGGGGTGSTKPTTDGGGSNPPNPPPNSGGSNSSNSSKPPSEGTKDSGGIPPKVGESGTGSTATPKEGGGEGGGGPKAASDNNTGGSPPVLWNPKTGQVFSWGSDKGWQAAGHVSDPSGLNGGKYGTTGWTGSAEKTAGPPRYSGPKSLVHIAAWQAGNLAGKAMSSKSPKKGKGK